MKKHGPVVRLWFGDQLNVLFAGPKEIEVNHFSIFPIFVLNNFII